MKERLIELVEKDYIRTDMPEFKAGDTLDVALRVKEGQKERIQHFEGVVIRVNGGGIAKTFTIRKVTSGFGVERILPINSPMIESITVKRIGKVRRARLFYLRGLSGKKARITELRK
ncbi:MAG: 50S ribosomal protein L19 [Fusobacteria bacterium]|nr:MAG: 50S ribosomal protein L19 [Fusobacteriota bacterium]